MIEFTFLGELLLRDQLFFSKGGSEVLNVYIYVYLCTLLKISLF